MGLTQELLSELEAEISELTLVPGRGGIFEVYRDDELVFSKKQVGRHANPGEVLELLKGKR